MANKFNIVITATDRATAVVRKFKDRVAQITKPVRDTMSSFKKFSKELGLGKLAAGFMSVTRFAASAATKILGAGAAMAGVATIASLTALAEWARSWGDVGAAVLRSASVIGIGTTRIQSLTAAAEVFGLTAEDMKGALQGVGDTMQDAMFGRNQAAMAMMNRLHIQLKRTKDGAVDTAQALMDVSRAIVRQRGAQPQAEIARAFGMEGILPLLQKGPAYIAMLERQVAATRAIMDPANLKNASEFQQKISLLTLAITGLGNALGNRLTPFLSPAISKLTEFIEKISEAIAKHHEWASIQQNFLGNTTPGTPGKNPGLGGRGGWFGLGINPFGAANPAGPRVWDPRSWFDFSDIPKPAPPPPPKGTPAYYQWLTRTNGGDAPHKPIAPHAFNQVMPPRSRSAGGLAGLLKKYGGNIDEAIIAFGGNKALLDRFRASHDDTKTLPPEMQALLRRTRADPDLMKMITAAGGIDRRGRTPGQPAAADPHATVDVHFHGAPAGMRAAPRPGGKVATNVKIVHAMPDLNTP